MATLGSFLRSNSGSSSTRDVGGLAAGVASLKDDVENLSLSKKIARNLKQKFKKKKCSERHEDGESEEEFASSSRCLSFHGKAGGCRVGSCEELDKRCKRRFSSAEDCKNGKSIIENAIAMSEKFWRKGSRKEKGAEQSPLVESYPAFSLPDDALEMILVRLPWSSLLAARSVCKKWRCIIGTNHFTRMRAEGSYQSPWLFLFGVTRNGVNGGEMHVLDVLSDQWHRSSHDELKKRSLFSVANAGSDVYVVGGCSFSSRSCKKPLKEVLVFSPLKGAFSEAASMKEARSEPVVGVFEVGFGCESFYSQIQQNAKPQPKARLERDLDVYEDPHRYLLRRQLREALEDDPSLQPNRNQFKSHIQRRKNQPNLALIAVGGYGSWDEPLDSGEIYDPLTKRWVEIAKLPAFFGHVCCGAVCGGKFFVYSKADKLAGFDLEKGFWTVIQVPLPLLHLPDYSPKLVSCQTRLFVSCVSWCVHDGLLNRREKAVRKMLELDLKSLSWSEVSSHPDAPMDRDALFVTDQNMIYCVEMFRIFGQMLDFITSCSVSEERMKWNRVSRKHAANEADAFSCTAKSLLVVNL